MNRSAAWFVANFLLVAGFAVSVGTSQAAPSAQNCNKVFFFSGTSTLTAGWTSANPVGKNPLWFQNYSNKSFKNASLATNLPGTWVDPATNPHFKFNVGAAWISSTSTYPGDPTGEGLPTEDQWRLFRQAFTLPSGAIIGSSSIWYTADNTATVYMNGKAIGSTNGTTTIYAPVPSTIGPTFSNVYNIPIVPATGIKNEVSFVVRNYAFPISINPTGLLYKIEVNYCMPTSTAGNDGNNIER